jgi:hypothetical protein
MIHYIKYPRKIKKTEARNLLLATGSDDIEMNSKKSSSNKVGFGTGKLK